MTSPKRNAPWLLIAQTVLLLALAAGAFALSYGGLYAYATTLKLQHAWIFPVLLDIGAIAFSLAALRNALVQREAPLAKCLIWACLFASCVFQLRHAWEGVAIDLRSANFYIDLLAHLVAPLAMMGQLEVILSSILSEYRETRKRAKMALNAQSARAKRKPGKISDLDMQQAIACNGSISGAAKALGVAPSTVFRRVRKG